MKRRHTIYNTTHKPVVIVHVLRDRIELSQPLLGNRITRATWAEALPIIRDLYTTTTIHIRATNTTR